MQIITLIPESAASIIASAANAGGTKIIDVLALTSFIESDTGIAILGTPGGSKIITMVLLSILNWVNGGTADEMTSIKRFHHQYLPDVIQHENGALSDQDISQLTNMGHTLEEIENYGNMQVITIDKQSGKVTTSSDPRALIEDSGIDYY